jgi:septin family protein
MNIQQHIAQREFNGSPRQILDTSSLHDEGITIAVLSLDPKSRLERTTAIYKPYRDLKMEIKTAESQAAVACEKKDHAENMHNDFFSKRDYTSAQTWEQNRKRREREEQLFSTQAEQLRNAEPAELQNFIESAKGFLSALQSSVIDTVNSEIAKAEARLTELSSKTSRKAG